MRSLISTITRTLTVAAAYWDRLVPERTGEEQSKRAKLGWGKWEISTGALTLNKACVSNTAPVRLMSPT